MRHQVDGRKFGRNTSHRVAMLRNLANAVITQEQVTTTVQKAKEVRRVVDRLITLGKGASLHHKRLAFDRTRDSQVVSRLFGELAKRYEKRPGGYTRILKLADRRWGDAAEMAVIELVDHAEIKRGKAAGQPKADSAQAKSEDQVKDPFNRFRKMFGASKKAESSSATPEVSEKPKKTAKAKAAKSKE